MKLFAQIRKIDVEKREVWGQAVAEVRDRAGEIFDYEGSKPRFEKWSGDIEKATDGKSLGNIRAMHGNVAAGKVIAFQPDDVAKAIDIGTKIVDEGEWQKCLEGVYTGFSIGGNYVKKWKDETDPSLTRYIADPIEISLVDLPCVPTAKFTMVKADGVAEEVAFQSSAEDEASSEPAADAPPAEPPAQDSAPAPAADEVGASSAPAPEESAAEPQADGAEKAAPATLKKELYAVSSLAELLCTIRYLASNAEAERVWEKDDSTIPAQLRAWLAMGAAILVAMTQEETDELLASVQPADTSLALAASGDMTKRADAIEKLDAVTKERDDLKKRVDELLAQPEPPKGVVKVIEKAADTSGELTNDLDLLIDPNAPDFTLQVMKAAQRRGTVINPR